MLTKKYKGDHHDQLEDCLPDDMFHHCLRNNVLVTTVRLTI